MFYTLFLKVKAHALHGVGAHFVVGHSHVFGVHGIGFEGGGTFERGIKHHVAVRRVEAPVNIYFNAYESVDFALQAFEARLDFSFHLLFLFCGEFRVQCPKDNVFYHD